VAIPTVLAPTALNATSAAPTRASSTTPATVSHRPRPPGGPGATRSLPPGPSRRSRAEVVPSSASPGRSAANAALAEAGSSAG
jgi:hypothetical protein